jgi:hypothetical protein
MRCRFVGFRWQGARGASPLIPWEEGDRGRWVPATLTLPTGVLEAPESCKAVQTYLTLSLSFQ